MPFPSCTCRGPSAPRPSRVSNPLVKRGNMEEQYYLVGDWIVSDSAVASITASLVTIATMVIGFLTLWIKLKYGEDRDKELKAKADLVEAKIDVNTKITKAG